MQRKPYTNLLLAVVVISITATVGCDKLKARDKLNKGVQAYKGGQTDVAIEDFKQAKDLDPSLTNARLYLATAYSAQYIPGAPSPENIRNGDQAVAGIPSRSWPTIPTIFRRSMASVPFSTTWRAGLLSIPKRWRNRRRYHQKHVQLKPDDPEPYYWVGVIDWSLAFRGNRDMREEYNKTAKKSIKDTDPMPPALATEFQQKYGSVVQEGVDNLQKAIELRPDYDDAMAYLNLLYRQKADMETNADAREADEKLADDLVEKVKAIKQKKMENPQPTS